MTDADYAENGKRRPYDPPVDAILTGYYLMKAREHCLVVPTIEANDGTKHTVADYLWWAHQHAIKAAPIVSKQSGMFYMEPEKGLGLIMQAFAGIHKIGEAHDAFRVLMRQHGYRDITARDFAQYGAGGDR